MRNNGSIICVLILAMIATFWVACSKTTDTQSTMNTEEEILRSLDNKYCQPDPCPAPSPLVDVSVGDALLEFWPYTGENFSGTPQDPINLIFYGKADPRDVMSALLALDGDRTAFGFPEVPPFTMTWTDAIGDVQAAYGNGEWAGGTIQLALGNYEEARVHIRLFRMGDWTVANAHFEVLIPGTEQHQVLSWELAEQVVMADFIRSGLLDEDVPYIPTAQINQPDFREIPDMIYNLLPVELRMLIGGPLENVTSPVPIPSDGHAVILNLAEKADWQYETRVIDFVLNYDQVVPRPFCSMGEYDYIYAAGPIHLHQTVTLNSHGVYTVSFDATGTISVTPVDPMTGQPVGESMTAWVKERHNGMLSDRKSSAEAMLFQIIMPHDEPGGGWYYKYLRATSHGQNYFTSWISCGE